MLYNFLNIHKVLTSAKIRNGGAREKKDNIILYIVSCELEKVPTLLEKKNCSSRFFQGVLWKVFK